MRKLFYIFFVKFANITGLIYNLQLEFNSTFYALITFLFFYVRIYLAIRATTHWLVDNVL